MSTPLQYIAEEYISAVRTGLACGDTRQIVAILIKNVTNITEDTPSWQTLLSKINDPVDPKKMITVHGLIGRMIRESSVATKVSQLISDEIQAVLDRLDIPEQQHTNTPHTWWVEPRVTTVHDYGASILAARYYVMIFEILKHEDEPSR